MSLRKIDTRFVAQRDQPLKLSWFHGESSDLYVWLDTGGGIAHIQFAWGNGREHIVEWAGERGLRAGHVDSGAYAIYPGTPLVFMAREVEPLRQEALARFRVESMAVPPAVRSFVSDRLEGR